MPNKLAVAALLVAAPLCARADSDIRALTGAERSALGAEIRQLLLDDPALILPAFAAAPPVLPPQALGYQDEIDADLRMLRDLAVQIWATPLAGSASAPRLALVTRPDCPACDAMQATLTDWAVQGRLHLFTLPLDSDAARRMGLDVAPSYVLDTMIVRGDVPAIVLEKYLQKQGG